MRAPCVLACRPPGLAQRGTDLPDEPLVPRRGSNGGAPYTDPVPKRVLILGSTGSIGEQALEVVAGSGELTVVGLSAERSWERLLEQARDHGVPAVALADADAATRARGAWNGRVLAGEEGIRELIATSGADLVLNGIVGTAGLGPTIAALSEGIDVALANKESLVVGGELVTALAEATGARLLPVDSEHSALFQLIGAAEVGSVDRLVLTASGGPFRGRTDLAGITPADALAHPTWEMGGRITVDWATLMNKGFEVIEAHHLFGFAYDAIDVVVHPQSIVHASSSSATGHRSSMPATPTCGCRSPTRSTTRSAPTSTCRASTSPRSASSPSRRPISRRSPACAWRARRGRPAARRRAC